MIKTLKLTKSQKIAIENISEYINSRKSKYIDTIEMILYQANIDKYIFTEYNENILKHSQIALHFHPDRLISMDTNVIEGMIQFGKYRNQFETNISSGSVSAYSGGKRDIWENKVFKGAYQTATPSERPKYGSLNLTMTEDGPSPRFGSCYFLLKPEIKQRTTFTYGDTHNSPKEIGTIDSFELINAGLLNDLFIRGTALGEIGTNVLDFLKLINSKLPHSSEFKYYRKASKNLDFYIEAQVHGDISLRNDIDTLIADYSYKGTDIESQLKVLCEKYYIEIKWNSGLELKVSEFPNNFRGNKVPFYAEKFGQNGKLNAYLLGKAAMQMSRQHDNLQMLKYLWHCIVRFGTEIRKPAPNTQLKTLDGKY